MIWNRCNNIFTDGVVATGVVVGSILLAGDHLLGVEELAISAQADLINDGGLEVDEDSARNVFAGSALGEERVEGVVADADRLVGGHLAIGLDAMLKAERSKPFKDREVARSYVKNFRNNSSCLIRTENSWK